MASEPPKVFISYNRADRDWAEWIAGAIDRGGYKPIIQAWDFRPGQNFVLRMQQATTEADITIAVVSEAYLKAEFTQPEWAAAFAQDPTGEKRQLIPVRVTPCTLQGLLKPIIYVDLVNLGERDAEHALLDGLKPSGKPTQPPPFPGKRAESAISTAPFPPNVARLHGVPDLPRHYLPREEVLAGLKKRLLRGDASIAITGQGQALGVQGMGGIGKTVLAAALARDREVRQAFPDGIYWLAIGQNPNLPNLQGQLVRQLTGAAPGFTTEQEGKDALSEALEGRLALVVLDDVWNVDHADAFSVAAPPARLLITTRNSEVLVGLGAEEHQVDVLSPSDALKMLAEWTGKENPDRLPAEAAEMAKECGYLPLALAMIGAMIRLRPTAWKDALGRLRRADLGAIKRAFPGYPYPDLLRAIEVSVEGLESADRERYLDLAVFPEDQPIPEGPLVALWKLEEMDTRDCTTRLVARSLATWATDGASLIVHDLQRDLIRKRREKDLPGLHLRLVEVWDALPKLPDTYAWRWIGYHLVQAGRKDDLRRLLLDFNYLEAKLAATDTNALIADYDYLPEDKDLHLVQSAIRLSADVLARDPRQLAGQLTGRLLSNTSPSVEALLKQVAGGKAWPWLRPLKPSLTAPGGSLIRTLEGHTGKVYAVALTPADDRAVSASGDRTLRLWDLETGQTLRTLEGHTGCVRTVAVTADGHRAVSGSDDGTLRLWGLETGQTLRTLEGHTGQVWAVAVTPDGHRAVSGSYDRTLRLWDLESGRTLRTFEGHTGQVWAVAVTPDGLRVVSGSYDRTLRLWDLESGRTLRTFEGHTDWVQTVAVTPDGHRAVSGSYDRTLRLWDLETGQTVHTLEGHTDQVLAVAVTRNEHRAVSGSDDGTLRLWDLETGQTLRTLEGHTEWVRAVALTADGHRAVSGSDDGALRFWDLETAQAMRTLEGHTGPVWVVAVTADGHWVVSGSVDSTLRLWDLETGQIKRALEGHAGSIRTVALTVDGHRAVSGSDDRTLRLWDLETGQTVHTLEGHTDRVLAVALTADEHRAVSGSADRRLRLWDLETGQTLRTLEGHTGWVRTVAATADGHRAVSGSDDSTLRLWDLETGQTVHTLEGHTGRVRTVAFTADGRQAVSGSDDATLRLWDLETGQMLRAFEGDTGQAVANLIAVNEQALGFATGGDVGPAWVVAVTADGHRAVSGSHDGTLQFWDLEIGKALRALEGHTGWVRTVALTADGHRVASGSDDRTLRLWDLETGKAITTFNGETRMTSCVFTPDGSTIVAGDYFGRMHFLQIVEADISKPAIGDTKILLLRHKEQVSE